MGVKKRTYRTKDGQHKTSDNWAYEYFIDKQRFLGTIDGACFRTKKQAEAECERLKEEKKKQLYGATKIAFCQGGMAYYEQYLKRLNERREKSPHKRIQDKWICFVEFFAKRWPHKYLNEVTRQDIAALITELRHRGLKDSGVANYIGFLEAMYNFCLDMGLCELAEMPNFKSIRKQLAPTKKRTRYLSESEYDALIASYDKIESGHEGKYKVTFGSETRRRLVMFDVETGLRAEELLSLRLVDVRYDIQKIYIADTKNGKDRYVPLSKIAVELLHEQRQANEEKLLDTVYVFPRWDGKRYRTFKEGFKADVARAKLKDVRIHDLRRTFGSWRLQGVRGKKKNLHEVSIMLGHSSVTQTESTYAFIKEIDITL